MQKTGAFLNRGIVIKENAAQKYTTDAVSRAIVREICEMSGEPYQLFANRSDMAGVPLWGISPTFRSASMRRM